MRLAGVEPHLDLSGRSSSFAHVYVDPNGGRAIYMSRGATAEVTPGDVESTYRPVIEASATVSTEVSQLPLRAARRVLEIARRAGARTVVDLDVPLHDAVPVLGSREELEAVLRLADLLKPSLAATRGLASTDDPEGAAREIAGRFGVPAVVITTGEKGCVVRVDGSTLVSPAGQVSVLDTTGAGDAFLGGMLAALHHGLGWEDAARLGNACGAHCCEKVGAFPGAAAAARARVLELYASLGGTPFELPEAPTAPSAQRESLERFLGVAVRELEAAARGMDRGAIESAARLILRAEGKGGRLHVTGVGKPAHVARYGAALLSSVGTPTTFLDAGEATHGSVGQIGPEDVLVAVSRSGETRETLAAVAAAREMGARIVAVCGEPGSHLAQQADVTIEARVSEEGGPLGLAPRSSFLAEALALQALSVLLEEAKALGPSEYRKRHPEGALARRARDLAREGS
jgi:arabinose-5-phosphate isomerase